MKDCVVLFSGGLDSYIHLYWALQHFDRVSALFVNLHHRYMQREKMAYHHCMMDLSSQYRGLVGEFAELDLSQVEEPNGFIPLRNMYLLQLATHYSKNVVFGTLHHESAPDHRMPFIGMMEWLINSQLQPSEYKKEASSVNILTPFSNYTKTELVRWYLGNGGDAEALRRTVACYSEKGQCGQCRSCLNRWVAMDSNGIEEGYSYRPWWWALEKATPFYGMSFRQIWLQNYKLLFYNRRYFYELKWAFEKYLLDRAGQVALGYILSTGAAS